MRHLRLNEEYTRHMTLDSARDLASVARTCRRFYYLAMPTLWSRVELWPDHEWPTLLSAYPHAASKRVLSYVRHVTLSVYMEPHENYPASEDFYRLLDYISGCLRMLKDTRAIDTMYFHMGLYDPNHYASEYHDIIETINRTTFQILKRIGEMKLQKLEFNIGRSTARSVDILSIIERKVDKLNINSVPIADWAPRLQYFQRLKALDVARIQPRNLQAETMFWTAVHQLPNLTRVEADTVPIPRGLNLRFQNITNLDLYFFTDIEYGEWSRSLVTIFKQMPGLEKLMICPARSDEETRVEGRAMQVTTIACENLKDLSLCCPIPRGLVSTIARHCPRLTKCYFTEDETIDDEDLLQLSLSCPNLHDVRLRYARTITHLEYFAAFQQLEVLELFYHTSKFIDKPLLLKLVDSCPKLKRITVSDWDRSQIRRLWGTEFEDAEPKDLFAAAAELPSYFVPKISKGEMWTPDGLIEYAIRIDWLREDISQFRQLTMRFGGRLVRGAFWRVLISSRLSIFLASNSEISD